MKANIGTPSSYPHVWNRTVSNWVSNQDSNGYWVQGGYVTGDGATYAPNGLLYSTVPTSYAESNAPSGYTMIFYSAQPLNLSRSYEVVNSGGNVWSVYIAGALRIQRTLTANSTPVAARSEIQCTSLPCLNQCYGYFTSAQYKTSGGYRNFDAATAFDSPYTWFYTTLINNQPYQYITHANGM